MHRSDSTMWDSNDLAAFSLPRYYYGQRLDVRHFEAEQNYVRGKLWMLNQLVHGYGVICGLDVQLGDDRKSVVVMPGVALNKQGREIVVPSRSQKRAIPPIAKQQPPPEQTDQGQQPKPNECRDDECVQILVCFHTCDTDPEPVMSGGCDTAEKCVPGSVREGYKIVVREGKAPPVRFDCTVPDLLIGNRINYPALARWISQPCPCVGNDPCIPLANVRRPQPDGLLEATDIDITIRPVVYTLDLLFQLILALTGETQNRRSGKY